MMKERKIIHVVSEEERQHLVHALKLMLLMHKGEVIGCGYETRPAYLPAVRRLLKRLMIN
jgi:hypothetical protein